MSDLTPDNKVILAENAKMIRLLGSRAIGDLIEIGRILVDTRDNRCKHGEWLAWLDREFCGWSRQTADNFIHMYESFGQIANRVSNLDIDCRSLYLLAAPSVPQAARDEAIERSEAGERMTPAQIEEIIVKAIEPQLEAVRAEALQREVEIRSEYEGTLAKNHETLARNGEAIAKAVTKATAPLQKKIDKYEKKLAKIKEPDPDVAVDKSGELTIPSLEILNERIVEGLARCEAGEAKWFGHCVELIEGFTQMAHSISAFLDTLVTESVPVEVSTAIDNLGIAWSALQQKVIKKQRDEKRKKSAKAEEAKVRG